MRTFFRRYYTHCRYISATTQVSCWGGERSFALGASSNSSANSVFSFLSALRDAVSSLSPPPRPPQVLPRPPPLPPLAQPLDSVNFEAAGGMAGVDLSALFLDLRPYMNRSPVTIRKECAASRAHQVWRCRGCGGCGLQFRCDGRGLDFRSERGIYPRSCLPI